MEEVQDEGGVSELSLRATPALMPWVLHLGGRRKCAVVCFLLVDLTQVSLLQPKFLVEWRLAFTDSGFNLGFRL